MTSHKLSIIILSFNTARLTKQTIDSIYENTILKTEKFEIIVLDNASSDESVKMLKILQSKHKNLTLIESAENTGFSKGNNRAAKHARGTYLLFLNSDIIVKSKAIDQLLTRIKSLPEGDFVGGKLLNEDSSEQASCGPFYSLPVIFGALFLKGDHWGLTRYSPQETRQVDWVSGACIMTSKKTFEHMGGFDEDIFMYMEEIDLLYRSSQKGYNTYFIPEAQFVHLGSASSDGKSFPIIQVYRGFLYFYKKHGNRFQQAMVKRMLQLKAQIAILVGKLLGKPHIVETYAKAQKLVELA